MTRMKSAYTKWALVTSPGSRGQGRRGHRAGLDSDSRRTARGAGLFYGLFRIRGGHPALLREVRRAGQGLTMFDQLFDLVRPDHV
jgi:hypothetical protein